MIQYVPLNSYTGLVVLFLPSGIVSKVTVRFPNDVAGLDHDELLHGYKIIAQQVWMMTSFKAKRRADFIRHLYTTVMNAPIVGP